MTEHTPTERVVTVTCGRCGTQRDESAESIRAGRWMSNCPRCHPREAIHTDTVQPSTHDSYVVEAETAL
jgi:hypothetical protein